MKIGLITYYKDNYGSILQCYSTKYMTEALGYECVVMYKREKKDIFSRGYRILRNLAYSCRYRDFLPAYIKMKNAVRVTQMQLPVKTKEKMEKFVDDYLKPQEFSGKDLIRAGKDKTYSKFIVGSDQIWNCSHLIDDIFFAPFAAADKKIAFGISFGVDRIPDYNKSVKKRARSFNAISVREETGKRILESFYPGEIQRIGDPTTMLDKEMWEDFAKDGYKPDFPYVLVHFLNEPTRETIAQINRYLKSYEKKAVCAGPSYDVYDQLAEKTIMDIDPVSYVSLIGCADAIFTDSFHTTVFSVNLQKNFYCFQRQYLNAAPQTSRLSDLLKRIGLEERFIEDEREVQFQDIDYDHDYLEKEREITYKYLKEKLLGK